MPEPLPHPAACPYCGGTIINQCETVFRTRPAQLNDDGSILVVGDMLFDSPGPSLLFCHGCTSTYPQPAEVPQHYDAALEVDYPPAPAPGDPAYRGIGVAWTPAFSADRITIRTAGEG